MLLHLHCHDERHSKLTKTILKSSSSKQPKRIAEVVVPEGYAQEQGDAEMTVRKDVTCHILLAHGAASRSQVEWGDDIFGDQHPGSAVLLLREKWKKEQCRRDEA
jgi:hypothetical protein